MSFISQKAIKTAEWYVTITEVCSSIHYEYEKEGLFTMSTLLMFLFTCHRNIIVVFIDVEQA